MAARLACPWHACACASPKRPVQPTFFASIFPSSPDCPLASIEIDPDSLPALPAPQTGRRCPSPKAADANPTVQAAVEHARAQYLRVRGERKSLWPSIDFAAQYANLATYNNYQKFYAPHSFQPNNVTIGVAIHFPFFNYAQHARVQEAESEAFKATKQAEAARNQVSEETLRLRALRHPDASRPRRRRTRIRDRSEKCRSRPHRMDSSAANLHDLDNAQIQASERLITLQDVTFELERSQVALLRATGNLESWALGTK